MNIHIIAIDINSILIQIPKVLNRSAISSHHSKSENPWITCNRTIRHKTRCRLYTNWNLLQSQNSHKRRIYIL